MNFNIIDIDTWDRKEYFNHFIKKVVCTYSTVVNIDITKFLSDIKLKSLKFYPTFIYVITQAVNSISNFKMSLNDKGILGYWDQISPSYTIFHEDDKTFSAIYTEYNLNFEEFYKNCIKDISYYSNKKGLFPKGEITNSFPVSCLPWVSFTNFNINVFDQGKFLSPIITWGKYFEQNQKVLLPIALQIHHAVADGYHVGKFFSEVQDYTNNFYAEIDKLS